MKTHAITDAYKKVAMARPTRHGWKTLAPYLVWPLLLLINGGLVITLLVQGMNPGLALTAGIFSILGTMLGIERLLPYRRDWHPTGKEWLANTVYFAINGVASNAGRILTAGIVSQLATGTRDLPLFISIMLAVLLSELVGYWWHRLGHQAKLIWRFHGIHHVPAKVNLANNNTVHFVDLFTSSLLGAMPALLLGLPAQAIAIAMFLSSFQSFFAHINADAKLGWLGYVVMGPEHHRYHHSVNTDEALNYGVTLSVWDHLFGTFLYRPNTAPAQVGVTDTEEYPDSTQVIKMILKPFH